MTSTRERQRAAARARLEREMAERSARARKRRQTQAIVGAAAILVLVVAGTVWLATSLGGDDDDSKQQAAGTEGFSQCAYTETPKEGRPAQVKDVGLPPNQQANKGTQTMTIDTNLGPIVAKIDRTKVPCTAGSFTHLASKGFFDNTKCHRLVTEGIKVLQCGDPSATGKGWRQTDGTGGPSYGMAEENLPTDKRPPTRRASSRWPTPGRRAAPAASSSSSTATRSSTRTTPCWAPSLPAWTWSSRSGPPATTRRTRSRRGWPPQEGGHHHQADDERHRELTRTVRRSARRLSRRALPCRVPAGRG